MGLVSLQIIFYQMLKSPVVFSTVNTIAIFITISRDHSTAHMFPITVNTQIPVSGCNKRIIKFKYGDVAINNVLDCINGILIIIGPYQLSN